MKTSATTSLAGCLGERKRLQPAGLHGARRRARGTVGAYRVWSEEAVGIKGHVKHFKIDKGWGHITAEDGVDYFVHIKSVTSEGVHSLWAGDCVVFEAGTSPEGKPVALNVAVTLGPRIEGIVRNYYEDTGSGTVVATDGTQYGVTRANLEGTGYRYLAKQERVTFEVGTAPTGRPLALRVTPSPDRLTGTVATFDFSRGFGHIKADDIGQSLFFHFSGILQHGKGKKTAEPGERVEFDIVETEKGLQANAVKRLDPRMPLMRFGSLGDRNEWLDTLATRAQKEPWDYAEIDANAEESTGPGRPILWSYVMYTFARLKSEADTHDGKIAYGSNGGRKYACFNTGLVSDLQEEIFAFFVENHAEQDGTPWKLVDFLKASDPRLLSAIPKLPVLAEYYNDPSALIYDRRRELHIGVEHIIRDNLDRFPLFLRDKPDLARNLLNQAQTQTQQRVYRNYKTAIPQFHRGALQLLLPLCLETPAKASLALVVSRHGAYYRGDTVLPMHLAYNNARLLARPDSEWLTP